MTAVKAIELKEFYENLSIQGEDEELYVKPKSYWMEEFPEETKILEKSSLLALMTTEVWEPSSTSLQICV